MNDQYEFDLERYLSKSDFKKIKALADGYSTPFLIVLLDKIKERFQLIRDLMPYAQPYYAVKANPDAKIISLLNDLGSSFDFASVYELDQLLSLGIDPGKMSFGNTIKKEKDIHYAFQKGVRLFCTDSEDDLLKISRQAAGARVFFRILTEGTGADWPLSRKFGAHSDQIYSLILQAANLGLIPYGVSFHVGSQQRDIGKWDDALSHCKYLFDALQEDGIELEMINMGGGFPANYKDPAQDLGIYTREIKRFLEDDFGKNLPRIIIEPGRSLVADAGVLVSEVVNISTKAKYNENRWVYLDVGMFNGLIETMDEAIKYPVYFENKGVNIQAILAGPTCDSMDILYEDYKYLTFCC